MLPCNNVEEVCISWSRMRWKLSLVSNSKNLLKQRIKQQISLQFVDIKSSKNGKIE